ncbi:hypothetical protein [Streptomyces sp. NPDC006645]|uniref:hypothetical protein n=1 Tax=unclassified Streptomyces TaxID=2593676 RepID=UPI0033A5FE7A
MSGQSHGGLVVVMGRLARLGGATAIGVVLLAGCTSDGGDDPPGPAPDKKGGPAPSASPSPTEVVDIAPDRLPDTSAEAAALVRDVLPAASAFGPGAVRQSPYESDPRRWAVLGDDCVWQQQALPKGVLATLTRSYEIPAGDGRAALRLSAVVTAHRTPEEADWENAEVLEEMMRCPSQQLRSDELITSLRDIPASLGESGNEYADDVLTEIGSYTKAGAGGPHPYIWEQTRIGQFTLAVSAKGARGWSQADLLDRLRDPHVGMRSRLRAAIERDPSGPGGGPSGDTKAGTQAGTSGDASSDASADAKGDRR